MLTGGGWIASILWWSLGAAVPNYVAQIRGRRGGQENVCLCLTSETVVTWAAKAWERSSLVCVGVCVCVRTCVCQSEKNEIDTEQRKERKCGKAETRD